MLACYPMHQQNAGTPPELYGQKISSLYITTSLFTSWAVNAQKEKIE